MKRFADSRPFWWILITVAVAVAVGMTALIILTDGNAGNWFTVIGAGCTIIVAAKTLHHLAKTQRDSRAQ